MKKFTYFMAMVVGLFSSLFAGTARAECAEGDNTCGTNCCYHITEEYDEENETTRLTGTVYPDVEGEEAIFAESVFDNSSYSNIEDVIFSEGITKITASPKGYYSGVNIHLPDSLKDVEEGALYNAYYFISDNVDTSGWNENAFLYSGWWSSDGIFCVGNFDTCREKVANFTCSTEWNDATSAYVDVFCRDLIQPASEEYCTGNYQWNAGKCEYIGGNSNNNTGGSSNQVSCGEGQLEKNGGCVPVSQGCGEGYRQIETWCNKIRWTPAEAAQMLTNDNNNTVTITFRK